MSRRTAPRRRPLPVTATKTGAWVWIGSLAAIVAVAGLAAWFFLPPSPASLRGRAEAAEVAKDWPTALRAWRTINATKLARGRTWLGEARACLGLDLAAQAESALEKASAADPADPEPWRLRLELLRTEGRVVDALRVGWSAYESVDIDAKRSILRALTLALLLLDDASGGMPDDRALARLDRWVAADPNDAEAVVAQHQQVAALPRPGDPDLASWVAVLSKALARNPHRVVVREALVTALVDAGEIDQGRSILAEWPEAERDSRYHRLMGRWDLEYDREPARALASLEAALTDLPHDWRTRTLLARVYQTLGRREAARHEAARVAALRELLDPATLVPRLANDFARPDDPRSQADLAALCARAGLDRLADAWRREAASPTAH